MSKFEKFPELKEGDLVVCGRNSGYLVTGLGAYEVRFSNYNGIPAAAIVGTTKGLLSILELDTDYVNDSYIPQAVFRPDAGKMLSWINLADMLKDYRNSVNSGSEYSCVWYKDRDEAKELTVDEVSKLLGYKVKIVEGNKNAGV